MRRALILVGSVAVILGAAGAPLVARAGTPSPITVTAGQAAQTYSGSVGPGQPDANGPPAPACAAAAGCDRETVNLIGYPANVLQVTVTYTAADPAGQNCLDVAIEDSTASKVLAHSPCVATGTTVTDPDAKPGTYTIEVDSDGSQLVGLAPTQSFTASVSAAQASVAVTNPTPTPASANPFTFSHEVSVDVQRGDGEPDLAISSDDKSLYSGSPYGFSTTVSLLWKSADGGVQWNNLHGYAASSCPADAVAVALRPDCSRGGGDAEVQLSQPGTAGGPQRVQFEDLNGLDSISCAYSDTGGDTFHDLPAYTVSGNPVPGTACDEGGTAPASCQTVPPPTATCGVLGTDRQWVQVWPKADQPPGATSDILYMTFDTGDQPPSGDAAIYSPDNGQHWVPACTTLTGSSCLGGANGVGSRPGPLVINPTLLNNIKGVSGVTDGTYPTLYEFMGTNSNGTEVNISCDGGQTWSHVATSNGMAGSTTNDFVAGAIDSNGELYTAYSVSNDPNPWRVWFNHSIPSAASTTGDCTAKVQTHWANAQPLTGQPSAADAVGSTPIPSMNYAVMPWLTAGSPGRVDLVYYGTAQPVGYQPDSQASPWYLHMAQTLDGGSTWTDEQATETPMHSKSICFSGIGCTAQQPPGGDRNLLDFFQVKTDSAGRAVIIFTDDNNSAACAATCSPGIGLISEVQQATGPSLFGTGSVPPLSNALAAQSVNGDVRQAGVNATVDDPAGDGVVADVGHNLQGSNVPALDITSLNVTAPKANTLGFVFNVKDLSGGLGSAVTGSHTGANWLVTWRWNNDLWFAQATYSAAGGLTCLAGRPLSVYNDGEPKLVEYATNSNATPIDASGCSHAGNSIEIDVPASAVGGVGGASDTTNHELYGLTGWTGESAATLPASVCPNCSSSAGQSNTTLALFDNADETAPLDVLVGAPAANTPEAPAAPLLLGLGVVAVAGGTLLSRRRRRSAAHLI